MTTRGKIFLTILILGAVGLGVSRWWDKIAPAGRSANPSVDPAAVKKAIEAGKASPDVMGKLLAGTNAVSLIGESAIPPVAGVSDYDKPMKDGKLIVQFPINVWPGWAPIITANGGMAASEASVFYKRYGFYLQLSLVDDPVKARDPFPRGHSHMPCGTL